MASSRYEEIELTEFIQGAIAVDPDVRIEDLQKVAEDTEKLEKIISGAKELSILIVGKTGTGKSTLINGLIGEEVAKVVEELSTEGVTHNVECYHKEIETVDVSIFDSPGLQDGSGKEHTYLDELYEKCCDVDLIIFAIRMGDNRFVPKNPDAVAMVNFTKRFQTSVWKRSIVAITCANLFENLNPQLKKSSVERKKKSFQKFIKDIENAVHATLIHDAGVPEEIALKVKVVPTGHQDDSYLIDGSLWFSVFWYKCFMSMQTSKARLSMIKLNARRFRTVDNLHLDNLPKSLEEQPIFISEMHTPTDTTKGSRNSKVPVVLGAVIGPAAVGGLVGVLGLLAGPVGLVGMPIGIFAGLVIGGIAAANLAKD